MFGTIVSIVFLGVIFAGAHIADLRIHARTAHYAATSTTTTRRRVK